MADHRDLVARIKAELEARGQKWENNCNAWQITARVAWELRDEGARLIEVSEAANHCLWDGRFYSIDKIAFPGVWVDILGSAGPPLNLNNPQWDTNVSIGSNTLWPPFNLDPVVPPVVVDPEDPPPTAWITSVLMDMGGIADAYDEQARRVRSIVNTVAAQASTLPK